MFLFRIPLLAALLGCVWIGMGIARVRAGVQAPIAATCASPELATADHAILHDCDVVDLLVEGPSSSTYWVVLAAQGTTVPRVAVSVHAREDPDALVAAANDYLQHAEFEIVRTETSSDRDALRSFPAVATATFVGEWREADDSVLDSRAMIYFVFGTIFIGADVVRILSWVRRRMLGR